MDDFWSIIMIIVIFDTLLFGGLGLFIIKSDKIYLKDEGRWMPGFNLPRLYAEPGDIVDHEGFKKHVGFSLINFGILFTIVITGYLYLVFNEILNQTAVISIFMLVLFGLILYLVYSMFTKSEKYIKRVNSKRIRYDKYIYRMLIGITILNTVPYLFTDNILLIVLVTMVLTFVVVGYYLYKIYQLLKENKKDFL